VNLGDWDPAIKTFVLMFEMDIRLRAVIPESENLRFFVGVVFLAIARNLVVDAESGA
jgi:hypothetical protein